MIIAMPGVQIAVNNPSANPPNTIMAQVGGIGISCPNGVLVQEAALPPGSSNVALAFPVGVTVSAFVFIAALTATDLIIKTGSGLVALPIVPVGQGFIVYGLTAAQLSLSSLLGGQVQYVVGG